MYKDIEKPQGLMEVEGRCPLCGIVMQKTKSISYNGQFYSFDFPLYLCMSYYHGYFRWLGGSRGHVRVSFPEILNYGRIISSCEKDDIYAKAELILITCPDCGFKWEELNVPHNETWCPSCGIKTPFLIK